MKTCVVLFPFLIAFLPSFQGLAASPPSPWNREQIAWRSYEYGLAEAKATGKPVLAVVHATWCPVCTEYRKVFHDRGVVKASRDFVMVLVDKDANPAASAKLDMDGAYVPRTVFLRSSGVVRADLISDNPKHKYFLDPERPEALLTRMRRGLQQAP